MELTYLRGVTIKTAKTIFQSGGLNLVGMIYIPDGEGHFPAVVVCHPHPQYGGNMDNNVVDSLCEALAARSLVSFKFNFRGVGGSQGISGNGIGEQDDVRAAVTYVTTLKEVDSTRIGLVGYSAGAAWGLAATFRDARIKALAAVSPPLSMSDFSFLGDCPKPKLMLSGTEDSLIPVDPFLSFCRKLPGPKECYTIDGADHFWWGYEAAAAGKVASFFNNIFLPHNQSKSEFG